jgi:hypothetical protein
MLFKEQKQFLSAFFIIGAGTLLFYCAGPYLPQKIFTKNSVSTDIAVDSLMIEAMRDADNVGITISSSIHIQKSLESVEPNRAPIKIAAKTHTEQKGSEIANKVSSTSLIRTADFKYDLEYQADSTGNVSIPSAIPLDSYNGMEHLTRFFKKLYTLDKTDKGKVRIAYYGDSMIDGDLIVQDFRSALQNRFGGQGVGFVSIQSESAKSRYSIKHYTQGNWREYNYMKGSADSVLYGINGAVFFPSDSTAKVSYQASGIKNSYRLNSPRLFYGAGNKEALLKITEEKDSVSKYLALDDRNSFNTVIVSSQDLKKIQLDFSKASNTPIYGIDFSNSTGVAVDGFSNRGNSGLPLSLLNISHMKKFDKALGYDLLILQFGANVLTRKSKSYHWYSSRMTKVVRHLHLAFPEADILILGTADQGTKNLKMIKTDTSVVKLLRAQQQYAARTESSFMSLFHLMGGVNSMGIWNDKKLANDDFTHFSPQGSRKIGQIISAELIKEYSSFAKAKTEQIELLKKNAPLEIKTGTDSVPKLPNQ